MTPLTIALALGVSQPAAAHNDLPPYPEIVSRIARRDDALFRAAFEDCQPRALEQHLHEDFRMLHDLAGLALDGRNAFIASLTEQCDARAPGGANEGYRNRRLLTPGTRIVRPLGDWGALEEATHSFFEWRSGEWVQVGGARYMHVWQWMPTEGQFRLLESLSYDHGAALEQPSGTDD